MEGLFNLARYRLELHKQSKAQRKNDAAWDSLSTEADNGDVNALVKRDDDLYEWKQLILTRYYQAEADRLAVQMPGIDDPGMYKQVVWDNDPGQPRYLTPHGVRVVKAAIREEQKHRREVLGFWSTILIGVIGAITGLASVLK